MSGFPHTFATYPGGTFPAADWDTNWLFVGKLSNIFCTASGSNSISLTPTGTSPTVTAYQSGMKFTFIAASTSSGAVSIAVASLPSLPAFDQTGVAISASSAITSGTYYEAVFDQTLNSGGGGFRVQGGISLGASYTMVTAAGNYTVQSTDSTILMNKTVGAATSIILPTSSTRATPVTVKDYKYDANTNNITFVPQTGETIDGFSAAAAITNGVALIDINGGFKTLAPLTSGGWYVIGIGI